MKSPIDVLAQPELEVRAIFAHNQTILASQLEQAGQGVAVYRHEVEGKRCFASPINVYVERTNGKILAITSLEKEQREKAYALGRFLSSSALPNVVHPVAEVTPDKIVFGDIAKVPVWYQYAYPILDKSKQVIENKILIDRPDSWPRNNQIILNHDDADCSLDVLLPDSLDRAVFLKSLDNYNSTPEPNFVDASR